MTKAEEKAIDAWAVYEYREHPKGLYHTCFVDGYKEGYKQAEKDLALTWEDVQLLDFYAMECQVEESKGRKFNSSQEFFDEVLRRFNKVKEEKK